VMKGAITLGAVSTIASGWPGECFGIALDSTSIYWTESSGGVLKAPK
jgi:hypothetical protein